ncbi:MAG TPA: PIG-L family deacetylase, partial [Tepidiformaceae bacterium]
MPKLLAIIPHPDDEAYSFGGTIALATLAGWKCLVVCCSSGEAGELNGGPPNPATLGPLRER